MKLGLHPRGPPANDYELIEILWHVIPVGQHYKEGIGSHCYKLTRSPPLRRKTTCEKHDLLQSGKSSLVSWPDFKLIPQRNKETNIQVHESRDATTCQHFPGSAFSQVMRGLITVQGVKGGAMKGPSMALCASSVRTYSFM